MAIISFNHKGLKLFFERGIVKGIQPAHAKKLANILVILDTISAPEQMTIKSYRLHELTGDLKGYWSMHVNANWRVTFGFIGTDIELVDIKTIIDF
ncbi:type II toxin-antitoxin system RelE/ParE family toxin [Bartonella sp. ML70XJBT.G]|uniref:type II toxin-antitoxin system RelE/ParE family toxin n=1 Tax=Bartonella sp. ML70XJBT.G TaxID=3019093 RepID=UPI00235F4735|nr:type II toxin-antitoxin system RelE/ParE family toxin [Bartonella sp. ML70XJBT.G]